MPEISKDSKVCSKQYSPDCIKIGTNDKFAPRSRVCKICTAHKNREFYLAHREKYIEKAKKNSKETYEKNKEVKRAQSKLNYAAKKQKLAEVKAEDKIEDNIV